jgi:hypothetical protein
MGRAAVVDLSQQSAAADTHETPLRIDDTLLRGPRSTTSPSSHVLWPAMLCPP